VSERAAVEAHVATCADCYEIMSEVLHVQEEMSAERPGMDVTPDVSSTPAAWNPAREPRRDAPVPRPGGETRVVRGVFGRRKAVWSVVGGVLATAAALVLVVRLQPTWWTGGVDPKLADLVEAVGEERTVEARLTGGFKYGPLRSPVRSGGRAGPTDNWALLAAAGRIREEAEKDPTPENLHALGLAQVLAGQANEAIDTLSELAMRMPQSARLASDLAAAYIARAENYGAVEDNVKALQFAERATQLDPQMVEAWFNRALALKAIGSTEAVRAAWEDYLKHDSTSRWADEVRGRSRQLDPSKGRMGSIRRPASDALAPRLRT
jgi:hypothetical protein